MRLPTLAQIQNLPINVRVRILWVCGLIVALSVGGIWFWTTKQNVGEVDPSELVEIFKVDDQSKAHYVTVERVERNQGKLNVYFKVTNPSGNILNFSQNLDTTLTEGDNAPVAAEKITDRQGIVFFFKILSHSEKYGIATFTDVSGDEAVIKFSNMFLEGQPETGLIEAYELDLTELSKPLEPRS